MNLLLLLFFCSCAAAQVGVEAQLDAYWQAEGDERAAVAARILALNPDFDSLYLALERGRAYVPVRKKLLRRQRAGVRGMKHRYVVRIPDSYALDRPHPVRVFLHGGVQRDAWSANDRWWPSNRTDRANAEIDIYPAAWRDSIWWQWSQVENLRAITNALKRELNIDENRVFVSGVSDGGTGAFFVAMRDTTPYAGFLIYIGHPSVLMDPRSKADGRPSPVNLINKPLFIVNTTGDPLYPAKSMSGFITQLGRLGVNATFRSPDGGHDLRWLPKYTDEIREFRAAHPREPMPRRVVWRGERTDRYNRVHWIVVDELEAGATDGWIDVKRSGNDIVMSGDGIARVTILLSPAAFDLSRAIRVSYNGGEVIFEPTANSVAVLMRWHQIDDDRTMLFARELKFSLRDTEM